MSSKPPSLIDGGSKDTDIALQRLSACHVKDFRRAVTEIVVEKRGSVEAAAVVNGFRVFVREAVTSNHAVDRQRHRRSITQGRPG